MLKFNKRSGSNSIHTTDSTKLLTASSTFAVKEAYNSIRTNLLFTQQGEKCPIFVVTSPTANNGKTINSANLAINFAQMGKKTLVIDADMRNPSLHKLFSLSSRNGLSEILAGLTDNITVTKTDIENLSVLTSGKIPPNPTELLSSPRMDKLLDFVKEHYDCVFIDTPPINIVTDATVFAQKATGYILIVKTDTTNVPELKTTVSTLQGINANILGFILNDANSEKKKYYSYYRKYSRSYSYNYKYAYGNSKN
ncbi:CpsD/CapB family tyrosine-protein kinase [uncultured Eubacterium sp.]|jgi:capsular exopolysaccharide family|uniref:CpsD/CapB family tyrosine-protein kinase n=1 Tax=uncultured Eubacterium sp. TaxID=165185 RepID=UPI0026100B16|nr:CpsD/CapB family tyrosine-protein kinase [uncultured Eubacterium sp.]